MGNYWAYYPPYENQTHTTLGSAPRIWTLENGPLSASIAIEHHFELPRCGHEPACGVRGESRRSAETRTAAVRCIVTLRRGERRLDIETIVDNTVENHRLRVAFPTGIAADRSHAGSPFSVEERPAVSARDSEGRYFNEMQTLPMSRFVDISGNGKGLAVLSDSFTEYELRSDPDHTLYLTLFRAMGNMIVTGWECVGRFPEQKGSQLQRGLRFSYSLYPHAGGWTSGVCPESRRYALPMRAWQTMGAENGVLPDAGSFCGISEPALVVSCLKRAEDRPTAILRVYNPTPREKTGEITFLFPLKAVWETDLNERRGKPLELQTRRTFRLSCPSNRILTFEIEWDNDPMP